MASLTRQLLRASPLRARIFSGSRQYAMTSFQGEEAAAAEFQRQLKSKLNGVFSHAIPNTVSLLSYFSAPESREIPHAARRGTGFFVDPTLIVTSARAVGLVSTFYDSDRSAVLHNSFIARTIACTVTEEVLCTRPVAVSFEGDVAVLEILTPRNAEKVADLPPPPILANSSAGEGDTLLGLARHGNCTVLACALPGWKKNSGRPKAGPALTFSGP